MPTAWLCDFDGTIAPADIGAAFAKRFSPGGRAERPEFLERWLRGEMGHRALTEAQCRLLAVSATEALAFTRGFGLDPAFAPFARERIDRGDVVVVVSEGFDFYVADQLARVGLGGLPRAANRLRFEGRRVTPEFPFADPSCPACGNCKGRHVRVWRERGHAVVLVGDGLSDRCGARAADAVLARATLLAWCRREGLPARPFRSFADVTAYARSRPVEGPAPALRRSPARASATRRAAV
jgi:2-hydroxy-3-keto-5-methylthiopentenyl-1-phosphate phosphatase